MWVMVIFGVWTNWELQAPPIESDKKKAVTKKYRALGTKLEHSFQKRIESPEEVKV